MSMTPKDKKAIRDAISDIERIIPEMRELRAGWSDNDEAGADLDVAIGKLDAAKRELSEALLSEDET